MCDALDVDPTFVSTYGDDSTPYYWFSSGRSTGPYYRSGILPVWLSEGTCAQAYAKQNSCPVPNTTPPSSEEDKNSLNNLQTTKNETEAEASEAEASTYTSSDGDGDTYTISQSTGYIEPGPGSCFAFTATLPKTMTIVSIAETCLSTYNKSFETGYEDSFVLYVEKGVVDGNLCDEDVAARYTPVLTSADWVEPISGRRYMCYEFMDGDSIYNVLTMSLGNLPCSGPESTPSPSPLSSPSGVKRPFDGSWHWLFGGTIAAFAAFAF